MDEREGRKTIAKRLESLRARIEQAAGRSGRPASDVSMVAVTKGFSEESIRLAYDAGLRCFGENRVGEALPKMDALVDLRDLEWHMVGHIQSRKAREVAPRFDVVHSVDSLKLARRLDRFAGEAGRRLPVLLECNVSGETSKEGWALARREQWPGALTEFEEILALPHLEVRGLMTMAPFTEHESTIRPVFRALRELRDHLQGALAGHWNELSMGMSADFEIAIEEGATIIRVGQAIFGPRASYC